MRGDAVDIVETEVEDLARVESEYPAPTSDLVVGLPLSLSPHHAA